MITPIAWVVLAIFSCIDCHKNEGPKVSGRHIFLVKTTSVLRTLSYSMRVNDCILRWWDGKRGEGGGGGRDVG